MSSYDFQLEAIEPLEDRNAPGIFCATSSSCNCTSSSCVYWESSAEVAGPDDGPSGVNGPPDNQGPLDYGETEHEQPIRVPTREVADPNAAGKAMLRTLISGLEAADAPVDDLDGKILDAAPDLPDQASCAAADNANR